LQKLILNDTADYFIKVIQPKLDRLKIQEPFDYTYKTLQYYNKNIWDVMKLKTDKDESDRTARARAFSTAKNKIYFNRDLDQFITLTYKENMQDYDKLKQDIKIFLNKESRKGNNPKYIWVVERQKRGALHIHLISNSFITSAINRNKYPYALYWEHGFSSIKHISGADINFKPYLYLFKYMQKSEKIGGRYVHASRNLKNFDTLTDFNFDKTDKRRIHSERIALGSLDTVITRHYYKSTN